MCIRLAPGKQVEREREREASQDEGRAAAELAGKQRRQDPLVRSRWQEEQQQQRTDAPASAKQQQPKQPNILNHGLTLRKYVSRFSLTRGNAIAHSDLREEARRILLLDGEEGKEVRWETRGKEEKDSPIGQLVMLRDCRCGMKDSKSSGMEETLQSAIVSPSKEGKAERRFEISRQ